MLVVFHLSLHFTHAPQHTHAFQGISIWMQFIPYFLIHGNLALSQNMIHPVTQTHTQNNHNISLETLAPVVASG